MIKEEWQEERGALNKTTFCELALTFFCHFPKLKMFHILDLYEIEMLFDSNWLAQ